MSYDIEMIWTPKLIAARDDARNAHNSIGQKRKYTGEPYFTHTEAVAELVASFGGSEEMIIAAIFHDTEEDVFPLNPYYSIERTRSLYGDVVTNMVVELTDTFTKENYPHLGRKERKQRERERLAKVSEESKLIKICDLLDNTKSIVEHDPNFARTYLREKTDLLPLLRNPFTEKAWQLANEQLASNVIQTLLNK